MIEQRSNVNGPKTGRPPLSEARKQGRFIGFKVKRSIAAALWAEAERREMTPTELIRTVLEDFVRQQAGQLKPGQEVA